MIHKYPWTDMHELNLDWFLAKFKELVEEWNRVEGDWNTLHDYVQNYFDNLNVQAQINNKIDAMIADGSFALILTPLVEAALPTIVDGKLPAVVASQIGAVVTSQIGAVVAGQLPAVAAQAAADEVGTWLAAHIDPDTGYVIDDSLTVQNAAADAKAVGDGLALLNDTVFINSTNFKTMSFPYTAGSSHSSSADKLMVNIPQGEKFYIKSTIKLPYLSYYAFYADGTNASIISASNAVVEKFIIASKDIIAISVYFGSPSESGTFTFNVLYGLKYDMELIENNLAYLGDMESIDISYTAGAAHSSSIDKLLIKIADGKKFRVIIDSDVTGYVEIYGMYGNTQSYNIGNVLGKSDNEYTATHDIDAISVYFGSQASSGTLKLSVMTGRSMELYSYEMQNNTVIHNLRNAAHVPYNHVKPLTIIHFSDIHAEQNTLTRIKKKISQLTYDDAICTGDMVAGTYAPISGWWDADILTCIGNHDTASYSGGVYDWTALSMADRDAYYIAPFEANWDITHTSGKSYYYKDYSTEKVRLIVMDAMLYNDGGADAADQNTWLENLLTDAITNNLHVLIAIHAPHGGSNAVECSFSRYNQGIMPVNSDCNTPQSVIDIVAAKITAGLNFIGYIVGHTHQDNIWKADSDGKQHMYCITCAAITEAQWSGSDQYRGVDFDAFNIITIDTYNSLIKIIRGGGADIDDHMRERKAITFNYSTGEIVGEIN